MSSQRMLLMNLPNSHLQCGPLRCACDAQGSTVGVLLRPMQRALLALFKRMCIQHGPG